MSLLSGILGHVIGPAPQRPAEPTPAAQAPEAPAPARARPPSPPSGRVSIAGLLGAQSTPPPRDIFDDPAAAAEYARDRFSQARMEAGAQAYAAVRDRR